MQNRGWQPEALWTGLALAALLAWDASGLDMALARQAGDAGGFALRHDWLLTGVLHDAVRRLAWALSLLLCLGVWWPVGPLARLAPGRRLQLAAVPLLASLLVTALKGVSGTSCPWDLADFGGVARLRSHWGGLFASDGGAGHCFPAGHAAAGFAFVAGYFVWRGTAPRTAHLWLGAALAAGLTLGAAQQLRGAHFMSHTLWTGWLCWTVAWASDGLLARAWRWENGS